MEALLRWQISSPRKVDQREREVRRRPTRGSGTHIPTQPQSYCLGYSQVDLVVVKVKVTQLCPAVCNPMDYTFHGILQARILEWVAIPFSRGIFPAQGLNPHLLHCRQIVYRLTHQGNPALFLLFQRKLGLGGSMLPVTRVPFQESSPGTLISHLCDRSLRDRYKCRQRGRQVKDNFLLRRKGI